MRQFEIPYNFNRDLLEILKTLDPSGLTIDCIYLPPHYEDYQTISRTGELNSYLKNITRQEYEKHISVINEMFPNKIQLLLQQSEIIMPIDQIKYYISLGISKFCVGSFEQAQLIKNINNELNVIGSISMKVDNDFLNNNKQKFLNIFDGFVLPFKFGRDIEAIKNLPKNFYYIFLVNAYCNNKCHGVHHWYYDYESNEPLNCPGLLTNTKNSISWEESTRIRPMDLGLFDRYISVYKLQDRGWPTSMIIRDYVLYTSEFSIYPNITYDENIYKKKIIAT